MRGKCLYLTPWLIFSWGVLLSGAIRAEEPCALGNQAAEMVELDYVHDGDTLALKDGRKVRVLGINAPELARRETPAEPLALQAKQAAVEFFGGSSHVKMKLGVDAQDRYNRWLAFVYNQAGDNLSAYLLARGLAAQIVMAPNVENADCLRVQEQQARVRGLGIWGQSYFRVRAVNELTATDAGFRLVQGRVTQAKQREGRITFTLDEQLQIHIEQWGQEYWHSFESQTLLGRTVTVRGWLVKKQTTNKSGKQSIVWLMNISHPLMMEVDLVPSR